MPGAEIRPLNNASPAAQGGPTIPAQQWTAPAQQMGPTGPTVPTPSQMAFAQVKSPNYGAAAAAAVPIIKWGGQAQYGGYGYWLYSDGSVKIVIAPSGKGVGTVVTRASNKAAYEAILNEFVRLNPHHPQVSVARAYLTGSQQAAAAVSPIATVTTALTAMAQSASPAAAMTFQPSAAAIDPTAPGAEPQSWMATIASLPGKVPWWVWVLGGGAVLVTAAGGAYWMTSKRAKRRENPVEAEAAAEGV
jgi:hypothetical protein